MESHKTNNSYKFYHDIFVDLNHFSLYSHELRRFSCLSFNFYTLLNFLICRLYKRKVFFSLHFLKKPWNSVKNFWFRSMIKGKRKVFTTNKRTPSIILFYLLYTLQRTICLSSYEFMDIVCFLWENKTND